MDIQTKDGILLRGIPDGTPDDVIKSRIEQIRAGNQTPKAPEAPKGYTTSEALGNAALNFIPDVGNVLAGAGHAIMHPIDTTKNVLQTGAGELSKVLPQSVTNALNRADEAVLGKEAAQQIHAKETSSANAMNELYKNRYGSYEGFKKALAEHPAEVAADVSTLLGGAGAVTKGSKLGDMLSKASEITNPLTPVTKTLDVTAHAPGSVARQLLGVTTGVGADTVGEAYKAGKAGNKVFMEHLKGTAEPTAVLDEAKNALNNIKMAKNDAYRSGMVDISNDKTILNFNKVDNAIKDATDIGAYKGKITNQKAIDAIKQVKSAVNDWKEGNPNEFHTPEGIDNLKQKIGSILEDLPYDSKARVAVQNIYNATKQTIKDQAPTYEKVMKDYSEASDLVNNIQKTLSLTPNASVDTAMRKLQSLTRNNVQTNYGQRVKLAEELAKNGGENIMPALAGQAMNEWLPRGLIGKGEDIAAILGAAHMSPSTLAFPLAMPRVVGTAAYGAGKIASKVPNLPITANKANELAQLLYQMHNASNQGE